MKKLVVLMCVVALAGVAMAQLGSGNPAYTGGAQGLQGIDKLGGHQNGGRGCQGCHVPHSGARGNGGNAAAGGGAVTDPNTGIFALWGEDLGPLYGKTLAFGDEGSFPITLPAGFSTTDEATITGVVMCLGCHDGNFAKGAMMANQSYEQMVVGFPAGFYGPNPIPTLLGADLASNIAYENDHPIGPTATLGAVGVASRLKLFPAGTLCSSHGTNVDCLEPDTTNTQYMNFYNAYGAFNITQSATGYNSGGRTTGVIIPAGATDATSAYLVCTTCHTPHSMYVFSGTAGGVKGTYPTFFFVTAPYNPFATPAGNQASSATQFCRQCHFTGAGGSNEGSNITGVTTKF